MYCKKCGSRIDENTGLCPICDAEQKYSNLKKAPESRQNGVPNQPTVNSNGYANLKKPEQNAQASPVQPTNPVQQPAQPNVPPVMPIVPVPPVAPAQPAYTPQPVRDVSGWSKKDIKALDRAEKIESRNRSTKIKNAIFKALAVVLACIISMTAVTGVFVYYDKLDIPAYSNVLDYIGVKQTAVPASKTTSTDNGNSDNSGNENNDNGDNSNVNSVLQTNQDALKKLEGTEEDAQVYVDQVETVSADISSAEKKVNKKVGKATPENSYEYLSEMGTYFEKLKSKGSVTSYEVDDSSIIAELPSGVEFYYAPEMEGYDAGTSSSTLQIGTYQPCKAGYGENLSRNMEMIDEGAALIDNEYSTYEFNQSSNYDDDKVSPEAITSSALYNVILWHGHGNYNEKYGSILVTGIKCSSVSNVAKYYEAFKSKSLLFTLSGSAIMTRLFIDNYIADGTYANTVIYLGTCLSGKDERLANSFIDKGASAVIVNNESIYTVYNTAMIKAFSEGLTQKYDNGGHYNVYDALNYAFDVNGSSDPDGAHPYIVGDESFTLDWYESYNSDANRDVVMVLDTSGSMSGEPLDQTRIAANNFIKTVLDESQANIWLVDYNSGATVDCEFSSNATKLHDVVNSLECGGGTDIESGLNAAATMLSSGKAEKKIIVLMSDGCANEGKCDQELIDYASTLKSKGIYIYTLGFFNALSESEKTSAQVVMDGIASEGCHYEVDDANNLVYFFDDIANQINGTRYIYVKIACPVDVTVKYDGETLSTTKENQTRTSFGTLTYLNAENSKNEEYDFNSENEGDEDKIKMLRLKEGVDYDIQIKGYDDGEMDYSIGFMDENGEYSDFRDFEGINITKKTVIDTKAQVSDTTTLKVDEDGDGKYDYTMKANANSFGKVVKVSKLVVATIFVTGGAVLVISIAIALSKRKKRKALIKRAYKTIKTA